MEGRKGVQIGRHSRLVADETDGLDISFKEQA